MASTIIHLAVANEVNKKLNRDNKKLLLGSIAPDISKLIGEKKKKSHFLPDVGIDIPNIDWFLLRYKQYLNDDFVMGYYIHLYTDYLWYKYFISDVIFDDSIIKLDGTKVKCTKYMISKYLYNDYTNLNIQLINEYNLDLKIFYEELPKIDNIIKEIPLDKLYLLVEQAGIIIENSKESKEYIINIDNVKQFINNSVELIISNINDLMSNN